MDRLINNIILVIFSFSNLLVFGQEKKLPSEALLNSNNEKLIIHTNNDTFLTGETMYYKLYCMNSNDNSTSIISKIAYVELINSNKESVYKGNVFLEKGIGYGDFFIPSTLNTGSYKIVAYTKWMLNKEESYFSEININIINPFTTNPANKNITITGTQNEIIKSDQTSVAEENSKKNISIELDKKEYRNREKATIKIKQLSKNSEKINYSISIRKRDSISRNNQNILGNQTIPSVQERATKANLPELRGEFISGKIISTKTNETINNKAITLSIPGKSYIFKTVKTNHLGEFKFILDEIPNTSEAVIQVLEQNKEDYKIELDKPVTLDLSKLNFSQDLRLSPNSKKEIEERSVAVQIENAYYHKKKDSIEVKSKMNIFLGTKAKEYILDNYTRFPTIKETITEIITECHSRKKNNKSTIYLTNDKIDLRLYGDPLVLVDGLLLQDVNEIFEYNMENIDKIRLINEGYISGPKTFGGIVCFETKNNDFQSKSKGDYIKKTTLELPSYGKKYNNPDYSTQNTLDRIPDYRYQLLWNPDLQLKENESDISFFTSDVTGVFEVILQGFTDKGAPFVIKDFFEVK